MTLSSCFHGLPVSVQMSIVQAEKSSSGRSIPNLWNAWGRKTMPCSGPFGVKLQRQSWLIRLELPMLRHFDVQDINISHRFPRRLIHSHQPTP